MQIDAFFYEHNNILLLGNEITNLKQNNSKTKNSQQNVLLVIILNMHADPFCFFADVLIIVMVSKYTVCFFRVFSQTFSVDRFSHTADAVTELVDARCAN